MNEYKISVVSIWYNQANYIEDFVSSLCNQAFKDFEVIFVDDGSSDGIEQKVATSCSQVFFDWVYIKRPDKGFTLNTSRNYGLAVSRADRVIFLDGDMLPSPKLVERHYNNLVKGANSSVGSRIRAS